MKLDYVELDTKMQFHIAYLHFLELVQSYYNVLAKFNGQSGLEIQKITQTNYVLYFHKGLFNVPWFEIF